MDHRGGRSSGDGDGIFAGELSSGRATGDSAAFPVLFALTSIAADDEEIVGKLIADFGISTDDSSEGLVIHEANQFLGKGGFVVETVAITEAGELFYDELMVDSSRHGFGDIFFAEAGDPEVELIDVLVD